MALFAPFRAVGLITDDVPFAVQRRGKETYVTLSVGKSWQVRAIVITIHACMPYIFQISMQSHLAH